MATASLRTERIEARLLPEQKQRVEQAARLRGLSVSDFMVQQADEAAIRTIERHQRWSLNEADASRLVQALLKPASPGPRLRAAAKRYAKLVRE